MVIAKRHAFAAPRDGADHQRDDLGRNAGRDNRGFVDLQLPESARTAVSSGTHCVVTGTIMEESIDFA